MKSVSTFKLLCAFALCFSSNHSFAATDENLAMKELTKMVVSVERKGDPVSCTGVIIASNVVLTSRYCVSRGDDVSEKLEISNPSDLKVQFSGNSESAATSISVKSVVLQPMHSSASAWSETAAVLFLKNDIPSQFKIAKFLPNSYDITQLNSATLLSRESQNLTVGTQAVKYLSRTVTLDGHPLESHLPSRMFTSDSLNADDLGSPIFVEINGEWDLIGALTILDAQIQLNLFSPVFKNPFWMN